MNQFAVKDVKQELRRFSPADAAIAKMAEEFMPLTINGIDDAAGYRRVHSARMVVKGHRVDVEKLRKELKADALEYGRQVDAEAKRITALLVPVEQHLEKQEAAIDAEKERIRNEARLKAEAEARAKAEAEAARIKAEQEAAAAKLKAEQEAEAERLSKEREALEAERRKLEAEREAERRKAEAARAAEEAKQRAEREAIEAERRKVEAEAKRLADIEAARLREIESERIRKEAAERARIETEQRIAREAAEAKAKLDAEEAERKRLLALRPDREKLLSVAGQLEQVALPEVSIAARGAVEAIGGIIAKAAADIRKAIDKAIPEALEIKESENE